jgi:hypothetical protein
MRPKIVLLTLLAAFLVLGAVALLKGLAGKSATDAAVPEPAAQTAVGPASAATNEPSTPVADAVPPAVVSDEMRAAVVDKEIDDIQSLPAQADGSNNPVIIATLVQKLSRPEAALHHAALEALKQLDDTNAIPPMQQAAAAMTDPREKVAVLDAIDYLNLPGMTQNVPPDLTTNPNFVKPVIRRPRAMNNGQLPTLSQPQ